MTDRKVASRKPNEANLDFLYRAILSLETTEECEEFFKDLCTTLELKSMSQRLYVAKMLECQKIYNDIVTATGASTATISRVNRTLNDERTGNGYRTVFARILTDEDLE